MQRVANTLEFIQPTFLRQVQFMKLESEPAEKAGNLTRRLDELGELAQLGSGCRNFVSWTRTRSCSRADSKSSKDWDNIVLTTVY